MVQSHLSLQMLFFQYWCPITLAVKKDFSYSIERCYCTYDIFHIHLFMILKTFYDDKKLIWPLFSPFFVVRVNPKKEEEEKGGNKGKRAR